jgi:hypothetical protein
LVSGLTLLLVLTLGPPRPTQSYSCLPNTVSLQAATSVDRRGDRPKITTVADTLKRLHAKCVDGRLVDRTGKEVRFYHSHCFGAPTNYALETMKREREELEALRKKYLVIQTSQVEPCA